MSASSTSPAAWAAASGSPDAAAAPRKDASPLALVFVRDLAVGVAVLSIWAGAEAWARVSGLGLAVALSSIGGFLVGAAVTSLAHEWGHFTGARLSGAAAPIRPAGKFLPLFVFDLAANSDAQFRAMSVGGNLAHWMAALTLFFGLPGDSAGQVAVQSGALGFVAFASVIEIPIIRRAFAGESGSQVFEAFLRDRSAIFRRARRAGLATALGAFLML